MLKSTERTEAHLFQSQSYGFPLGAVFNAKNHRLIIYQPLTDQLAQMRNGRERVTIRNNQLVRNCTEWKTQENDPDNSVCAYFESDFFGLL